MERKTILSPCRTYRYALWREWDAANPKYLNVIGLNPSTADETKDDPTIRKCIGFAKKLGFGALCMTNLFAFRATQPKDMKAAADPEGPDSIQWLLDCADEAAMVIAAWGADGAFRDRNVEILDILASWGVHLHCLRENQDGSPGHPLYIPYSAEPQRYTKP